MTPEEFRKIIVPEGRRLYSFAFRFMNIREEAEDIVQEVMTKLWENRLKLKEYENLSALATTMTRNMCIDRLRRKKLIPSEENDSQHAISMMTSGDENEFDNLEASALAMRLITLLKEPWKSAVIMRDVEGYSYEEAAEALGTNVSSLRTILSRARKCLREEIEKTYSYGTEKDKGTTRKVL